MAILADMSLNINQQKKDKREWAIMNLFVQSCSAVPIGEIEKSESPDFIVVSGRENGKERRIGIELTELKYERQDTGFNMRAHEDYLSGLMEEAETIFRRSSDMTINVDVSFSDSIAPLILGEKADDTATLRKTALAETIAKIVLENLPEATGKSYWVDRRYKYGDMNLPQHIERIKISNVCGRQDESMWNAGIWTRVKPLTIESVMQRIRDKDTKLRHYNKTCDEQWLVIIQNSFLMSSQYDPHEAFRALKHRYRSSFKRIFVFERSEAKVYELNIIRKIR